MIQNEDGWIANKDALTINDDNNNLLDSYSVYTKKYLTSSITMNQVTHNIFTLFPLATARGFFVSTTKQRPRPADPCQ